MNQRISCNVQCESSCTFLRIRSIAESSSWWRFSISFRCLVFNDSITKSICFSRFAFKSDLSRAANFCCSWNSWVLVISSSLRIWNENLSFIKLCNSKGAENMSRNQIVFSSRCREDLKRLEMRQGHETWGRQTMTFVRQCSFNNYIMQRLFLKMNKHTSSFDFSMSLIWFLSFNTSLSSSDIFDLLSAVKK